MLVSKNLADAINGNKRHLEDLCESYEDLHRLVFDALQQDSLVHSGLLEDGNGITHKEKKRRFAYGARARTCLAQAWNYATEQFGGSLDKHFICEVVTRVNCDGENPHLEDYRKENCRITGLDAVIPVRVEKIERDMGALLKYANDKRYSALDRAALFHLHFARIHPFADCNGRTARLVQNLLLNNDGYPPATIPHSERFYYQNLMRQAIRGYQEREAESSFDEVWSSLEDLSEPERAFYDYASSKVNNGLVFAIEKVDAVPIYTIELTNRGMNPGYVISAKRLIDSVIRSRGLLAQVKVLNKKTGILEVRGSIEVGAIQGTFDKTSLFRGKYKLQRQH